MGKLVAAALGAAALGAAALVISVLVVVVGAAGSMTSGATVGSDATSAIPSAWRVLYQQAAATCPGLPWTVLAAIGTIESGSGASDLPGVRSGANRAGAEGPMQFEPSTFAAYNQPIPPGGADPPTPYDPTDAVYAAARMLCADGARDGADLTGAVYAYNHSDTYVGEVLALAQEYAGPTPSDPAGSTGSAGSGAGEAAVEWALAQVGTPYRWGGESPGVGFDCSGLVQAAYRAAGVSLPRTAQSQFDAGPQLESGAELVPGDLVFFGDSDATVDHVGIYVGTEGGQAVMVDAPYTGVDVRVEPFPTAVGAAFGDLLFLGATDPATASG